MNGISMTSQPSTRNAEVNAPACFLARETSTRQPISDCCVRALFRTVVVKIGVLRLRSAAAAMPPPRMTARGTELVLILRLHRYGCRSFAVNVFQYLRRAPSQQCFSDLLPECNRVAACLLFAQYL